MFIHLADLIIFPLRRLVVTIKHIKQQQVQLRIPEQLHSRDTFQTIPVHLQHCPQRRPSSVPVEARMGHQPSLVSAHPARSTTSGCTISPKIPRSLRTSCASFSRAIPTAFSRSSNTSGARSRGSRHGSCSRFSLCSGGHSRYLPHNQVGLRTLRAKQRHTERMAHYCYTQFSSALTPRQRAS